MAKKKLQAQIKEERNRQSHYVRKRRTPCKQRSLICPPLPDNECEDDDPKAMIKREKARERYCMKRRKMEQKLTKSLEKQYSKGECGKK